MAAKLVFNGEEVRVLCEHSKGSKEQRLTFSMLCNPAYLKAGVKLKAGEYAKDEEIDKSKIPAGLILAKDAGVYLLSGGLPALAGVGTMSKVAYAKGLGPDADYGEISRVAGGDDFAESLPLSMFEQALAERAKTIQISLGARNITLTWVPADDFVRKPVASRARPKVDSKELGSVMKQCGATAKSKWAFASGIYKGAVVAIGDAVMYQKVGRAVVVHEKALLPGIAAADKVGKVVTITYPEDVNGMGSVAG